MLRILGHKISLNLFLTHLILMINFSPLKIDNIIIFWPKIFCSYCTISHPLHLTIKMEPVKSLYISKLKCTLALNSSTFKSRYSKNHFGSSNKVLLNRHQIKKARKVSLFSYDVLRGICSTAERANAAHLSFCSTCVRTSHMSPLSFSSFVTRFLLKNVSK